MSTKENDQKQNPKENQKVPINVNQEVGLILPHDIATQIEHSPTNQSIDESYGGSISDYPFNEIDLDTLTLIPEDAPVYRKKVPKYKEIKHYIKGEKLGKGKFGTVREFVHKETLKRYAGNVQFSYYSK